MRRKLVRVTTVPGSIRTLLRGQLKYMSQEYEVIGVASSLPEGDLERAAEEQNARGYPIKMTRKITPFKDLRAILILYSILKKEKPFFIHSHTPKAGLVAMISGWLAGVPHRLHDSVGLPLFEARGFKRTVLIWVEKLIYFFATRVYPNSRNMMEYLVEHKYASAKKMKFLGSGSSNGVDTTLFDRKAINHEEKDELRRSLGIKEKDFTFIFVGRMVRDKGLNELLSVTERFNQEGYKIKLILVGNQEPDLNPISEKSQKILSTNPAVIAAGHQRDVRPFMAISDALVFPTYREGFPNVPMEAGSMELPGIVTDINGCNEIVTDGVNGLIIPIKDEEALYKAMKTLMDNPNLAKSMGEASRPLMKSNYERQHVWDAILEEYKSLEDLSFS